MGVILASEAMILVTGEGLQFNLIVSLFYENIPQNNQLYSPGYNTVQFT